MLRSELSINAHRVAASARTRGYEAPTNQVYYTLQYTSLLHAVARRPSSVIYFLLWPFPFFPSCSLPSKRINERTRERERQKRETRQGRKVLLHIYKMRASRQRQQRCELVAWHIRYTQLSASCCLLRLQSIDCWYTKQIRFGYKKKKNANVILLRDHDDPQNAPLQLNTPSEWMMSMRMLPA